MVCLEHFFETHIIKLVSIYIHIYTTYIYIYNYILIYVDICLYEKKQTKHRLKTVETVFKKQENTLMVGFCAGQITQAEEAEVAGDCGVGEVLASEIWRFYETWDV